MPKEKDGCVKPAGGPVIPQKDTGSNTGETPVKEVQRMKPLVGNQAPDFEANAYVAGEGFKQIKLSDYKGKWIVLCFYPGDFTFV